MKLEELVGRFVLDVWEHRNMEPGGLDHAECIILLDDPLLISFPYAWDDEIWVRDPATVSADFAPLHEAIKNQIVDQEIVDLIRFDEGTFFDKAILVLANGSLMTEISIAPNGTGHAGLWHFPSIMELTRHAGTGYHSLINST